MSSALKTTSTLEIAAHEVRRASQWLADFAQDNSIPDAQLMRLDICLNEALANVLTHGGPLALENPVSLRITTLGNADSGYACVTLCDSGLAFDSVSARLAAPAQSLEDANPGGLGLLMLRKFSDQLSYRRHEQQNVLSFSVLWPAKT